LRSLHSFASLRLNSFLTAKDATRRIAHKTDAAHSVIFPILV